MTRLAIGSCTRTTSARPALVIAAIGVVLGDIGTSPLYAIKEVFCGGYGVPLEHDAIMGILSLLFWALMWVVSVKYVLFVTRADNQGEGGVLALMALARRYLPAGTRRRGLLITLGLAGAALLYGDSMITPAVSVLSSVEGLELAYPQLQEWVVPIALVIIVSLFSLQRFGTEKIGRLFGPIVLLWFITLAVMGVHGISMAPEVLGAVNPLWAISFFQTHPHVGIAVFSAITLAITGAESLYADLGHFGRPAIVSAWLWVACPALVVTYFGQGALLLVNPDSIRNPFFMLAPEAVLIPLVILASMASVIASQAVITAAFSITQQAISLGYLPRFKLRHTSTQTISQIYIPLVNWSVMLGVLLLIVVFKSSTNLAAAYGVAVTGTMLITSTLMSLIVIRRWHWPLWAGLPLVGLFFAVDVMLVCANLTKFFHGGAVPVVIALGLFLMMDTWRRGRARLEINQQQREPSVEQLMQRLEAEPITRVKGCAIYLCGRYNGIPSSLRQNLECNQVLHERVILLTVLTEEVPHVPDHKRCEVHHLGCGVRRLVLHFGFMDSTNVPLSLTHCDCCTAPIDLETTTWFVGRESPQSKPGLMYWQKALFKLMYRNARSPMMAFMLPPRRVIEIGTQVEL